MEQSIDSMRVSLIWTLANPARLGHAPFGTRASYTAEADRPPDDPTRPPYVRPWHQAKGFSRFWAYYLGLDYLTAPASRIWNRLVPLRRRRRLSPEGAKEPRLSLFVWPHAVASVLDIEVETDGLPRDAAVNRALARATTERYRFAPEPDRDLPAIEGTASEVLRRYAECQMELTGGDWRMASRPDRPFAITTVLRGWGDEAVPEGEGNEAVWRAVHGMACLNPRWTKLSLPPVHEHRISGRTQPGKDGGVYGVGRGRVVWLPKRFVTTDQTDDALWWYHRNLTDLILQVEGHLALAQWASTRLSEGALAFEAGEFVRHSAQSLMWLYTGDRHNTYRSATARRQIDDGNVTAVEAVCDHFGVLPPAPLRPLVEPVGQGSPPAAG